MNKCAGSRASTKKCVFHWRILSTFSLFNLHNYCSSYTPFQGYNLILSVTNFLEFHPLEISPLENLQLVTILHNKIQHGKISKLQSGIKPTIPVLEWSWSLTPQTARLPRLTTLITVLSGWISRERMSPCWSRFCEENGNTCNSNARFSFTFV
jgi:hypothetical protein